MIYPAFFFVRSKIICRSAVSGQIRAHAACTPKPLSVFSRTDSNAVARDTKATLHHLAGEQRAGIHRHHDWAIGQFLCQFRPSSKKRRPLAASIFAVSRPIPSVDPVLK
jgi:hypothetical protein